MSSDSISVKPSMYVPFSLSVKNEVKSIESSLEYFASSIIYAPISHLPFDIFYLNPPNQSHSYHSYPYHSHTHHHYHHKNNSNSSEKSQEAITTLIMVALGISACVTAYFVGNEIGNLSNDVKEFATSCKQLHNVSKFQEFGTDDKRMQGICKQIKLRKKISRRSMISHSIGLTLKISLFAFCAFGAFSANTQNLNFHLKGLGIASLAVLLKWGFDSTDLTNNRDALKIRSLNNSIQNIFFNIRHQLAKFFPALGY